MTIRHTALSALALSASAAAQFVSPAGFAQVEGNSNNTWPFDGSQFTYQQIHGDTQGAPRVIMGMSFRRDTIFGAFASSTPRTFTLDAFLGNGNLATATATYATNYLAAPTQVVTNKSFNAPDWTPLSIERPAPFNFSVAFDIPFLYTGVNDLVWELRVSQCTATGTYLADFCSGSSVQSSSGSRLGLGTGCTTGLGTMTLLSNWTTSVTAHTLNWQISAAPASTSFVTAVGAYPLALPLPGLCGSGTIYTDGMVLSLNGQTSSTGANSSANISLGYNPALIGVSLYAQAAAVDASQTLGFAVSNGLRSTLSDVIQPIRCARVAASGTAAATSGSLFANNGLVTLFK